MTVQQPSCILHGDYAGDECPVCVLCPTTEGRPQASAIRRILSALYAEWKRA